jgi:hypothetical protein
LSTPRKTIRQLCPPISKASFTSHSLL